MQSIWDSKETSTTEAGRSGRFATELFVSEDEADSDRFVNGNDPRYANKQLFAEGMNGFWYGMFDDDQHEESASLAERLLGATTIDSSNIASAATVAMESPELLITLYMGAINPEGDYVRGERALIRSKMFDLIKSIFAAMLDQATPKRINATLSMHRVAELQNNPTVLSALAGFARYEVRNPRCGHDTAWTMLALLGHADPFASHLA